MMEERTKPPPLPKKSIDELQRDAQANGGYLSAGADKGCRHCVPLVKAAVPEVGPTST